VLQSEELWLELCSEQIEVMDLVQDSEQEWERRFLVSVGHQLET
jgi:hypothetical protein